MSTIKVKIQGREVSMDEAKAAMNAAVRDRVAKQFPNAETDPAVAQDFLDEYSRQHQASTGQAFTGQPAKPTPDKPA